MTSCFFAMIVTVATTCIVCAHHSKILQKVCTSITILVVDRFGVLQETGLVACASNLQFDILFHCTCPEPILHLTLLYRYLNTCCVKMVMMVMSMMTILRWERRETVKTKRSDFTFVVAGENMDGISIMWHVISLYSLQDSAEMAEALPTHAALVQTGSTAQVKVTGPTRNSWGHDLPFATSTWFFAHIFSVTIWL